MIIANTRTRPKKLKSFLAIVMNVSKQAHLYLQEDVALYHQEEQ